MIRRISCLMPTYNKLPKSRALVEEAIESFLRNAEYLHRKTDGQIRAELILCNDAPSQILCVADDRRMREFNATVTVLNTSPRFDSLGEKLNFMTQHATGEFLCRWDDDDLSLAPGLWLRVSALLSQSLDYVCFSSFIATNGEATSYEFGSYAQCMYRATAHAKVGGYRHESFGEDQDFEQRLRNANLALARHALPIDDTFYFYRWGTGSEHVSGFGRDGDGWRKIGNMRVIPGRYELIPRWYEDYDQRAVIAKEIFRAKEQARAANSAAV